MLTTGSVRNITNQFLFPGTVCNCSHHNNQLPDKMHNYSNHSTSHEKLHNHDNQLCNHDNSVSSTDTNIDSTPIRAEGFKAAREFFEKGNTNPEQNQKVASRSEKQQAWIKSRSDSLPTSQSVALKPFRKSGSLPPNSKISVIDKQRRIGTIKQPAFSDVLITWEADLSSNKRIIGGNPEINTAQRDKEQLSHTEFTKSMTKSNDNSCECEQEPGDSVVSLKARQDKVVTSVNPRQEVAVPSGSLKQEYVLTSSNPRPNLHFSLSLPAPGYSCDMKQKQSSQYNQSEQDTVYDWNAGISGANLHKAMTSPSGDSGMDELRHMADKLKLPTRRESVVKWKEKYANKLLIPLIDKKSKQKVTPSLRKIKDVEDEDPWSEEKKSSINESLDKLRNELKNMRQKDQSLARTLISLRRDIQQFKFQQSYAEHQDTLDEAIEREEEFDEFKQIVDLLPDQFSPTLKHMGVTKMNVAKNVF